MEFALEVAHVADVGATEGVDGLIVIPNTKHRRMIPGQQLQPLVLKLVGILKLIDEDMPKALLVMPAQRFVALQQLVTAQQQLREIDHAFALALRLVGFVKFDALSRPVVPGFDGGRAQALLLLRIDEVAEFARRVFFVIDVERFQQALDGRLLVAGIKDLEQLRQAGIAMVGAQQPVAQTMEGADPHAFDIDRQHGGQPRQHFLGRLVGESHGQDAAGGDLAGGNQPGDAGGQHPGLARTRAGEDQGVLWRQGDGGQLRFIEVLKKGVHDSGWQAERRLYRRGPEGRPQ